MLHWLPAAVACSSCSDAAWKNLQHMIWKCSGDVRRVAVCPMLPHPLEATPLSWNRLVFGFVGHNTFRPVAEYLVSGNLENA